MNLSDKQALLQKALEFKVLANRYNEEYGRAKDALKRAMENDGDQSVSSEEGSKAYYKSSTSRKFKSMKVLGKLSKEALLALVADTRATTKQVNVLAQVATGVPVDSLVVTGNSRIFTCELPRDEEQKARIEESIAKRAEADIREVDRRVKGARKLTKKRGSKKKKAAKKKAKTRSK